MAVVDVAIAVGSAVGLEGTAAAIGGGALMGAGAGGLYSAITGDGSIGKSMLNGALLGGSLGGIGSAAGLSSAASEALPSAAGVVAPGAGAAPVATGGVGLTSGAVDTALQTGLPPLANTLPEVSSGYAFTPAEMQAGSGIQGIGPNLAGTAGGNIPAGFTPGSLAPYTAPGILDGIPSWAKYGAGALALGSVLSADNKKYGTLSPSQTVSSPLPYASNYGTYKPLDTSVMRPMGPAAGYTGTPYGAPGYVGSHVGYAAGGITDANPMSNPSIGPVEQMSRDNALGQNQMFPQANINSPAFSSATNTPMGTNMIAAAGDTNVDPYTGSERFAAGGIAGHSTLGSYVAGGNPRLLKGPGDGMSDNIPATIGGHQPARLADGEFVVPADVVSHLGNGSTDAGADKLHSMMDKVRKARTGTKKQGKQIKADKFVPK